MSEKTLREILKEAVDQLGQPTFALFTTFNFDPVFFEDYVLPVFCEGLDVSTLRGVLSGDQFLRKMNTVVFFDSDQLAHGHKRLSYGAVPVRPKEFHFFHPKLILLGNDEEEFRLIVTSANLTVSGWGRHQEVVAGPITVPTKSSLSLTLFRMLEWLRGHARHRLDGVHYDRGWFKGLARAIELLETQRRVNDSHVLMASLVEEYDRRFLTNLKRYADQISAQRITIYSPYFASDLSGLVASLRQELDRLGLEVRIVPALEKTREGDLRVGICDAELKKNRGYELYQVKGDNGERFRHAKVFWFEGTMKRHVLVVGSHNFTKPALNVAPETQRPNVEASLVLDLGEKATLDWLGDMAELEPLDLDQVQAKTREELEGEAPRISSFACSVVADWEKREYRIKLAWTEKLHYVVTVELPGVEHFQLAEPQLTVPFTEQADRDLRKRKHYRAWLQGQDNEPIIGLICEVNWERFRQDVMGRNLADYIDVWSAREYDELADRSLRKQLRLPDGLADEEAEPDALAAIAERLERPDHLNTLYGVLGGFMELRRLLDDTESKEQIGDLLFSAPHSLANFVQVLQEMSQEQLTPVRRWVYFTEAQHLLAHAAAAKAEPGIRKRLADLAKNLESRCREIEEQTELRDLDKSRSLDKADLFTWFRDQFGPGFESLWKKMKQ